MVASATDLLVCGLGFLVFFLVWFFIDLYVSLCAPNGIMLALGLSLLDFANVSIIPFYDSLLSILSLNIIPQKSPFSLALLHFKACWSVASTQHYRKLAGSTAPGDFLAILFLLENCRERYYWAHITTGSWSVLPICQDLSYRDPHRKR